MNIDEELERQLRSVLRETLDRELGPDPVWPESPAARRVAELDHRIRRRWPLRVLAVAALIGAGGGAALLGGRLNPPPEVSQEATNGWIAFSMWQRGDDLSSTQDDDFDIWFAALDQAPRRVIGSDTDQVQQLCPAFSPDGRSLAYGRVEGLIERFRPADLSGAALVVADVSADGRVSDRQTIDIGDGLPPPCPVWSPDGGQVAFGVNLTSPGNPTTSAAGSEVWIVTLADGSITALPDLLATDLEWSPDGSLLAIASGEADLVHGETLQDGRIHLYAPSSGAMRLLEGTLGVGQLTWSPDSRFIAYTGVDRTSPSLGDDGLGLRVIDVETEEQRAVAAPFAALHGIGPVWSPDGGTIAYQRQCAGCGEGSDVVLLTLGDPSDEAAVPREVVIPMVLPDTDTDGSDLSLYPRQVMWSPDGAYLLSVAWGNLAQGGELGVLVAVPIDPDLPAVVLFESDSESPKKILADDTYDTTYVPIQTWGRQPPD